MIPSIEVDGDGYPTESSLLALAAWDGTPDEVPAVLAVVAGAINSTGYGRARRIDDEWHFATGGWSGCEDLVAAIPALVRMIAWQSSHRGGLHVYSAKVSGGDNG